MYVLDLFGFAVDPEQHHEELILLQNGLALGPMEFLKDACPILFAQGVDIFKDQELNPVLAYHSIHFGKKLAIPNHGAVIT
jgi:hypothetical protein